MWWQDIQEYSPKDMKSGSTYDEVKMDRNEDYRDTLARFFDVIEDENDDIHLINLLTDETVILLKRQ